MKNIKIKNVKKILFIENKANYVDYIHNKQEQNEFVIYHGGMYSPVKGEFFKKIYNSDKTYEFYHWSDIDIGGFHIFIRLKKIIPRIKPYLMDIEAFYSKREYWKEMKIDYAEKLEKLKSDKEYENFNELIEEMLKTNCKLEQEAFL